MSKDTQKPAPKSISNVELCIHTEDNQKGLEALLDSIVKYYPAANVLIADSARSLDRAYYKQLRRDLEEAGLINRITIHHVGYKVGTAKARNFLIGKSTATYRVFLSDTNVITGKTDLHKLVEVLKANKNIGVACADDGSTTPETEGKPMQTEGGVKFAEAKGGTPFMAMKRDVGNYIRYNTNIDDPHVDFFNRMDKVPFIMVYVPEVSIEVNNESGEDTTQVPGQPTGAGNGEPTQPAVQTGAGDGGGDNSKASRENEKGEGSSTGGKQGGSGSGPVPGKGDK